MFVEGNRICAEALQAQNGDTSTVRLAIGTRFSVPEVLVKLGVMISNFDSIKRCLVVDLDSRYDLILDMAWLERH